MTAVPAGIDPARTTIEIPSGRAWADTAILVIGGVAARFELPVDRVDDLLLAVDSLLMQETVGDTVQIETDATPATLVVRVGPFPSGRLDDGGLRRVLSRLVDGVAELPLGPEGRSSIQLQVTAFGRDGS
jgi:hypothetical protein